MVWPFDGSRSYRDDEDDMTEQDWQRRGFEQANAMREGGNAFDSGPDEDGDSTGGLYNGDYPDSWHEECNRRLDDDEEYRGAVGTVLGWLAIGDADRRSDEDSD